MATKASASPGNSVAFTASGGNPSILQSLTASFQPAGTRKSGPISLSEDSFHFR
jgi:hypothetical protein